MASPGQAHGSSESNGHELIEVIDCHQHVWDLGALPYDWLNHPHPLLGDLSPIRHTYKLGHFLAEGSGRVRHVKSVHVEAGADNSLLETNFLGSHYAVERPGFEYALTISLAIDAPAFGDQIAQHVAANKRVRGVRHMLNWHPSDVRGRSLPSEFYYLEEPFERGLRTLEAAGLHFEMHMYHTQLASFAQVPPKHPRLLFMLNHTGICLEPDNPKAVAEWRAGMAAMARHANVYCKISGLAMVIHEPSEAKLRPFIHTALELFGVDRCLFGSNFPVDKKYVRYDELYDIYDRCTRHLSPDDRRKLFRANAERFYRF